MAKSIDIDLSGLKPEKRDKPQETPQSSTAVPSSDLGSMLREAVTFGIQTAIGRSVGPNAAKLFGMGVDYLKNLPPEKPPEGPVEASEIIKPPRKASKIIDAEFEEVKPKQRVKEEPLQFPHKPPVATRQEELRKVAEEYFKGDYVVDRQKFTEYLQERRAQEIPEKPPVIQDSIPKLGYTPRPPQPSNIGSANPTGSGSGGSGNNLPVPVGGGLTPPGGNAGGIGGGAGGGGAGGGGGGMPPPPVPPPLPGPVPSPASPPPGAPPVPSAAIPVAAALVAVLAIKELGEAALELKRRMDDLAESLAPYEPTLATAVAKADVDALLSEIKRARLLGPDLAQFTRASSSMTIDFKEAMANVLSMWMPDIVNAANTVADAMYILRRLSEILQDMAGEGEEGGLIGRLFGDFVSNLSPIFGGMRDIRNIADILRKFDSEESPELDLNLTEFLNPVSFLASFKPDPPRPPRGR